VAGEKESQMMEKMNETRTLLAKFVFVLTWIVVDVE
jgi:hypothetical protein